MPASEADIEAFRVQVASADFRSTRAIEALANHAAALYLDVEAVELVARCVSLHMGKKLEGPAIDFVLRLDGMVAEYMYVSPHLSLVLYRARTQAEKYGDLYRLAASLPVGSLSSAEYEAYRLRVMSEMAPFAARATEAALASATSRSIWKGDWKGRGDWRNYWKDVKTKVFSGQVPLDPACRLLVLAMNQLPGIYTTECCEGHGEHPLWVFFTFDPSNPGLHRSMCILTKSFDRPWTMKLQTTSGTAAPWFGFVLEGRVNTGGADFRVGIDNCARSIVQLLWDPEREGWEDVDRKFGPLVEEFPRHPDLVTLARRPDGMCAGLDLRDDS